MSYGAQIPPPNDWQPRPVPLRWRLKAAWAALRGRSVILNVGLRATADVFGQGRLSISVGDGFQLPFNNYVASAGTYVNGVRLEEIDLSAEMRRMEDGPL